MGFSARHAQQLAAGNAASVHPFVRLKEQISPLINTDATDQKSTLNHSGAYQRLTA
jgi:hypothetical protein